MRRALNTIPVALMLAALLFSPSTVQSTIVIIGPPVKAKGSDSLYLIKEKDRWGYMNRDGQVVIEPNFDTASNFFEGLAYVTIGVQGGYINPRGEWEFRVPRGYAGSFRNGVASFESSEYDSPNRGLIDRSGTFLLEPKFNLGTFSEGVALITQFSAFGGVMESKSGFISPSGIVVIPMIFEQAANFSEGLAAVAVASATDQFGRPTALKWGFINHAAKFVIEPQFDEVGLFRGGVATFRDKSKDAEGVIDKAGNIVLQARYGHIANYEDREEGDLLEAWVGGQDYDFLRPDGSVVFGIDKCCEVDRFSEGLARIKRDGRFGFIDRTGAVAISIPLEDATRFSEGVTAAKLGQWGYVDKAGKWTIPPQFDRAEEFRDELALVEIKRVFHYIDKLGRMVRPNVWSFPPCSPPLDIPEVRVDFCGYR